MDIQAWLTVSQAARAMGVSRARVYQMLDEGKLCTTRIGGVRLVLRGEVEEWSALRMERRRLLDRSTEHLGSASTSEEGENVTDE